MLAYAAVPVIGFGVLGVAVSASAHGFLFSNITPQEIAAKHTEMFDMQASLLGVSVTEVKQAWADGKTVRDLAKEKGISDEDLASRMKTQRLNQVKEQLQTLVSQGVITQAQADTRYSFIEDLPEGGAHRRGMGMHFGGMRL